MSATLVGVLSGLLLAQQAKTQRIPPQTRGKYKPHPWKVIPPLHLAAPNGTSVNSWFAGQAAAAEQDDFVIYLHEWYEGGTLLGPYGRYHLTEIIARLPHVPFKVVVQPGGPHELNEHRRGLIVAALLEAGSPDAEQRVVLAYPQAEGLYATQGERLFLRSYGGAGQGGQGGFLPGGGLGTGLFGGSGFGGQGGFRGGLRGSFGGGLSGF